MSEINKIDLFTVQVLALPVLLNSIFTINFVIGMNARFLKQSYKILLMLCICMKVKKKGN